ncbi:hypothetical protein FACS1894202_01180 [Clostridia bacterium]|nr:hypothetical protein FACS1894202_01180 [Clostridia bacterium]
MDILVAINAISSILGISAKDIADAISGKASKGRAAVQKQSLPASPIDGVFVNDSVINDLVLSVLINFLWYGQTAIRIQKPGISDVHWQQSEYNILTNLLNEKLNRIGYSATVTQYASLMTYDAQVDIMPQAKQEHGFVWN